MIQTNHDSSQRKGFKTNSYFVFKSFINLSQQNLMYKSARIMTLDNRAGWARIVGDQNGASVVILLHAFVLIRTPSTFVQLGAFFTIGN